MPDFLPTYDQLRTWITQGDSANKKNIYPPEAVEPTLEILRYVDKHCNRNINDLVDHVRRRNINRDYNFFYQLLTGRYFRLKDGAVQGSWRTVREIWTQLSAYDAFATKLSQTRFVETSVWHRINNYVQRKRLPFSCCRFGLIRGHTGNQKTESFYQLIRKEEAGIAYHMESPADATLNLFIDKLNFVTGGPRTGSKALKREHIRMVMLSPRRFLIIDNIQDCFIPSAGARQPIFNYLRELQEDTKSTIIGSYTPVENKFTQALSNEYFEQFIGRIGGEREILEIEAFPNDDDVLLITQSFPFANTKEIEAIQPRLRKLVQEAGRVRALFGALQEANRLANTAEEKLTGSHVLQYLGE